MEPRSGKGAERERKSKSGFQRSRKVCVRLVASLEENLCGTKYDKRQGTIGCKIPKPVRHIVSFRDQTAFGATSSCHPSDVRCLLCSACSGRRAEEYSGLAIGVECGNGQSLPRNLWKQQGSQNEHISLKSESRCTIRKSLSK